MLPMVLQRDKETTADGTKQYFAWKRNLLVVPSNTSHGFSKG